MANGKGPQAGARARRARNAHVPNVERSIADAVVIKDQDLFFLADRHGNVPVRNGHGYGLYYHDCRFLSGYELTLAGESMITLASANRGGYMGVFRMTNRDLVLPDGSEIPKQTVGVQWSRLVRGQDHRLYDLLAVHNYGMEPVKLPLELLFHPGFEDIFEVRSLAKEHRDVVTPAWEDGALRCCYEGHDGVIRHLSITCQPAPTRVEDNRAIFDLVLGPQARVEILVAVTVGESGPHNGWMADEAPEPDLEAVEKWASDASQAWLAQHTHIESNSILLDRVFRHSVTDLHTLRSHMGDFQYFAAGIPWYGTLFGRDSLITAFQMLAFDPAIAAQTLHLLAGLQGREDDPWRAEQPGKILHEYRRGELANLGEVPFGRYYGSIDSTPLFLMLLAEHARWTGSLALFDHLREPVERALEWLAIAGDSTGNGYLDYAPDPGSGLLNQGWKDSDDAIMDRDGSLAVPPIELVEVQGYQYAAKLGMAELFERAGDDRRANALREEAAELAKRFDQDFWMPDASFYALALHQGGAQARAITSNPGQALWTGIVPPGRAKAVAKRLLAEDMFSGWGIRTLSQREPRYNPLGYHLGTVWPHDNALIMAGLRRYGLDTEAMQIFLGIFDAVTHFEQYRLPELFSGYTREMLGEPVRYPVACHPQAWAAAALPYMLGVLLGLQPEGFENRLRVVRPILPPFVDRLEVHRLRVGAGWVSLRFERTSHGAGVAVVEARGDVQVIVEPTIHG